MSRIQKHETSHGLLGLHKSGGTIFNSQAGQSPTPILKNNRVNSPSKVTLFKKTTIVNVNISNSNINGNRVGILKKFF